MSVHKTKETGIGWMTVSISILVVHDGLVL